VSTLTVKYVHVVAAAASFALFFVRGLWMVLDSPLLRERWVRIVPHVNDTVLLAAGVWLAIALREVPGASPWLTAKLGALAVYIGLGMLALRPGRPKGARVAAWLAALAIFVYIAAVAVTRSPTL